MKRAASYRELAKGVAKLFAPLVEVVLHNLDTQKIDFIIGNAPSRKAGDDSHLSEQDRSYPLGVIGPYTKVGEGGERQRSVSIVLPGEKGQQRYMLCINFSVGDLEAASETLFQLLGTSKDKALTEHFSENWQDKINTFIESHLRQKGTRLRQLGREEKKELVLALKDKGAFKGKHAAQYIADSLKISRASVYGYIKQEDSDE